MSKRLIHCVWCSKATATLEMMVGMHAEAIRVVRGKSRPINLTCDNCGKLIGYGAMVECITVDKSEVQMCGPWEHDYLSPDA